MSVKYFFLTVIAGVVAMAVYRTLPSNITGATQLGANTSGAGDPTGVSVFNPRPAPSGHGDATQNATGNRLSTASLQYAPASGANENQAGSNAWTGLV